MTDIALVDYGAGNLGSVVKGLEAAGARVRVARSPEALAGAAAIVVPGVGHFGRTSVLGPAWREAVAASVAGGRPVLGICLGMQWLFEGSEEAPELAGLGVFTGRCRRLTGDVKVPQVGWNALRRTGRASTLLGPAPGLSGAAGSDEPLYAYFANSFAAPESDAAVALARHGVTFTAAVERGSVFGVQFHPEKSGEPGLEILRRFVEVSGGGAGVAVPTAGIRGVARDSGQVGEKASGVAPISFQPDDSPTPSDLTRRIIACLDVRDGQVVKGVQFEALRGAGDPAALARRYNAEGIDELVLLDVTATLEGRRALEGTIRDVARELFIPLTIGGGIRSFDDAARIIEAGADKVSVNSAALADPALLTRLADCYGSQAVVVAIDAARSGERDPATGRKRYRLRSRSGTTAEAREAVAWAREAEARGAGEVLLTSIDRDGTRAGFDCEMTAAVSDAVGIPVIASGGAGEPAHFLDVFRQGRADAALAASVFHFSEHAVADLKVGLAAAGIAVRPIARQGAGQC